MWLTIRRRTAPLTARIGTLAALWLIGCGGTVELKSGLGSGGSGGSGGGESPGCTEPCVGCCNPASCPADAPPNAGACAVADVSCSYQEGPCTVAYACSYGAWTASSSVCTTSAVSCEQAADGDVCAVVGDGCGSGDECSSTTKTCGPDHRWSVTYYDNCCYDCCDGNCGCYPSCPPYEPTLGSSCDPCNDNPSCLYEGSLPECASANVEVICDPVQYVWVAGATTCP